MDIIANNIFHTKTSHNPLSSDVALINDNGRLWLFDVGNNVDLIKELYGTYDVVISHFHLDHVGSIDKVAINNLYVSNETYKHINKGIIVADDLYIGGIHIFKIPSSHAKGCLGLEYDEYAFVGDSLCGKEKDGMICYNVQLLYELIATLKKIKAKYIVASHNMDKVLDKDKVVSSLKNIYSNKDKNNNEIVIESNYDFLF